MAKTKKHSQTKFLLLIIIFTTLCALTGGGTYYYKASQRIQSVIGSPAKNLSPLQTFTLTIKLSQEINELTSSPSKEKQTVVLEILQGENATTISNKLKQLDLIHQPEAFIHFLIYTGGDTNLRSGTYILNKAMNPIEIGNALQSNQSSTIRFHLMDGWRCEEIGNALAASGMSFSAQDFIDTVHQQDAEGYLLPDTYFIRRDASAKSIIYSMRENFYSYASQLNNGFSAQGLSLEQATILASIVQREAIVQEEMPIIASVFLNRINNNMKLEADPTVQYAIGYSSSNNSWWKSPLSLTDLTIDSPYNTYIYKGLPPSPICNPGKAALKAVAFPAETNYFYFRALCDHSGQHYFSSTFEEHVNHTCP